MDGKFLHLRSTDGNFPMPHLLPRSFLDKDVIQRSFSVISLFVLCLLIFLSLTYLLITNGRYQ